jgi:hypothetical protein
VVGYFNSSPSRDLNLDVQAGLAPVATLGVVSGRIVSLVWDDADGYGSALLRFHHSFCSVLFGLWFVLVGCWRGDIVVDLWELSSFLVPSLLSSSLMFAYFSTRLELNMELDGTERNEIGAESSGSEQGRAYLMVLPVRRRIH